MANPRVSIIVPIYNVEPFLEQCVQSLVDQTCQDIEVILVDDGSPDKCGEICDRFAAEYPIVKVIHQENQGVSVARNTGMDAAQGEWLMFVDGDDWVELDIVEKMLPYAEEKGCDILVGSYFLETKNHSKLECFGKLSGYMLCEKDKLRLFASCFYLQSLRNTRFSHAIGGPWAKLLRKNLLLKHELRFLPGLTQSQDILFSLYAFQNAAKIALLDPPHYHYREHTLSTTRKYMSDHDTMGEVFVENVSAFTQKYYGGKGQAIVSSMAVLYFIRNSRKILHKEAPYTFPQALLMVKAMAGREPYKTAIRNFSLVEVRFAHSKMLAATLIKLRCYLLFCLLFRLFDWRERREAYGKQ
jgi:glycosyltransferase involved in cell wall biosynthesis